MRQAQYHVGVGVALILFGCFTIFMKIEVTTSQLVLILFGALLLSTSVISSLKFGATGFEVQTLRQVASDVASVLHTHEEALTQVSGAVLALNKGIASANEAADKTDAEKGDRSRSAVVLSDSTTTVARTVENADSLIKKASDQRLKLVRTLGVERAP